MTGWSSSRSSRYIRPGRSVRRSLAVGKTRRKEKGTGDVDAEEGSSVASVKELERNSESSCSVKQVTERESRRGGTLAVFKKFSPARLRANPAPGRRLDSPGIKQRIIRSLFIPGTGSRRVLAKQPPELPASDPSFPVLATSKLLELGHVNPSVCLPSGLWQRKKIRWYRSSSPCPSGRETSTLTHLFPP